MTVTDCDMTADPGGDRDRGRKHGGRSAAVMNAGDSHCFQALLTCTGCGACQLWTVICHVCGDVPLVPDA